MLANQVFHVKHEPMSLMVLIDFAGGVANGANGGTFASTDPPLVVG